MKIVKRGILVIAAATLCISTSEIAAKAKTNADSLHNMEKNLRNNQHAITEKEKEQQSVNEELQGVQSEWESIKALIQKNKEDTTRIQDNIKSVNQIIEKKKEEIVQLEDQVLARKGILKKRLVAFQKKGTVSFVLDALLNSESFDDLVNRINAISTLLSADNEILDQQKQDLKQIEKDKIEITKKEKTLTAERKKLADNYDKLQANLNTKQKVISTLQAKYKNINQDILEAKNEKSSIESKISHMRENIRKEQANAQVMSRTVPQNTGSEKQPAEGIELYMNATAYSYQDTKGHITALGYDIQKNSNMKLIAVDPSVIPLGSKVWVEGYGVAIAGDTGSAIVGHRIDVLMPSHKAAVAFGRRTVKIIILN
ncbi:3D domain-containing protein [Bacillus sp. FJAT-49736]|uniref:3D domain-containing protein n=1 Tax=Bacillus sp. FJAT-49736 TaxID=2833582 RepID=UPI001BC92B4C|nr:3D domain-containing protein [Bacillus sp. FJAT-49736]MBS4174904.1 hypothetical protein [Bacillus sp. FJAT-49736]